MKIKILFSIIFISIIALMVLGSESMHPVFSNIKRTIANINKASKYKLVADIYKDQQANALGAIKDKITATTTALNSANSLSIPVIVFHGVTESDKDKENILYSRFFEQMSVLKSAGYNTISHSDYLSYIRGEKQLPQKSILITFDDARKDSYYPVDPILKALDFRATMFVITNRFEHPFHLSKGELKSMQKSGRWDIESHGHADHDLIQINEIGDKGYFLTNKMWLLEESRLETDAEFKTRISEDLSFAKKNLTKIFKKEITGFAFPFGDYGQRSVNYPDAEKVISEVVTSNYSLVYHQVWEAQSNVFNYPNPNATTTFVKRIKPTQDWTGEYLVDFLEKASAKELPIEDDFSKDIGWKKLWGNVVIENNELLLNSTSTSAGAILDGTLHFDNYTMSANIESADAKTVTIFGRYIDPNSYVSCTFSENHIKVEVNNNGFKRVAFSSKAILPSFKGVTLGVESEGNLFGCTIEGIRVAYTEFVSEKLNNGSIGFFVWNSEKDAKLVISNVSIKK